MGFGSSWSGTGALQATSLQVIGLNGAELDIDTGGISGGNFPEIIFWNSAHTDYGKISLEVNPVASPNQMLELRSPAENSLVLPGSPLVQMRLFLSAFMELGNVMPPNSDTSIGGTLFMDETMFDLEVRDTTSNTLANIRSTSGGVGLQDIQIGVQRFLVFGPVANPFNGPGVAYSAVSGFLKAWSAGAVEQWNTLVLGNGWSNLGGAWTTAAYRLMPDGDVLFKGVIIGGTKTDGTVIATLPAGYRPPADNILIPSLISGGSTNPNYQIRVFSATGQVQVFGISTTTTGNMSLDGMRFSTLI